MKLILNNIGMLKHAEITLHKLCLIAGENDNGKSTVGKVVFCIVKAINKYKEDLLEFKEFLVKDKISDLFFELRANLKNTGIAQDRVLKTLVDALKTGVPSTEQLKSIDDAISLITTENNNPDEKLVQKISNLRKELQTIIDEPENFKKLIENALNKAFASEFDANLLLQGTTSGQIQLIENDFVLIDLIVQADGVKLVSEVEPIVLKDATFIETPLILNNHDILLRSQTLMDIDQRLQGRLGVPFTTLHTKDLFNKLLVPVLKFGLFDRDKSDLFEKIQTIINGEVAYNPRDRDFAFRREGQSISIKNTASGIKTFGLLQILVANEFVAKNTILIFDEPENHLHPKWQLKLAQLLLKLVEKGVYVLVSSHSPYLIEALKRGTDNKDFVETSGFYLAQNRMIEDKDNLSEIFRILAEPFEVFRKMDAEDLQDE